MPPRKRKYKARFEPKVSETELASTSYFENLAAHSSNATVETAAAINELNTELDVEDTSALFIQAYEATVLRGAQALDSARALEVRPDDGGPGDALVKWSSSAGFSSNRWRDDDDELNPSPDAAEPEEIWIDRYDARQLLDHLPTTDSIASEPPSPSAAGWSDLPSDTEDTFFFNPEETEDFRREKRRKTLERLRDERMAAIRAEADAGEEPEEEVWGDSDEEPDEAQKAVMLKTAIHIASSPNSAQLEMRILANYGSDKRFAFLRGRWSQAWKMMKGKARMNRENEEKVKTMPTAPVLGGLDSYGDSDADSGSDDGSEGKADKKQNLEDKTENNAITSPHANDGVLVAVEPTVTAPSSSTDEEVIKEARRQRARQWAEKRKNAN